MGADHLNPDLKALDAFVALIGETRWRQRVAEITRKSGHAPRAAKALLQRHVSELAIEGLRRRLNREPTAAERRVAALAADAARLAEALRPRGRERLLELLTASTRDQATLIPLLHLLRTAALQRARGFSVQFAGLEDDAHFDLLITRGGAEAEVACDVISAEEGRGVHRGAWFRLADRIDPDLQTWLSAHPGRYLLKMTLPQGLRGTLHEQDGEGACLARLHEQIRGMLADRQRSAQDPAVVLRLDPLLLAAAQADELGLLSSLRREFGPEAHLSVTAGGDGVFVMAARAGREDEIATAIKRRMAQIAPARLSGARPGILAMFVEDTDRGEWRHLRDRLDLEGEARQFLTLPEARPVVAVSYTSRAELFGVSVEAAEEADLRFRNPSHPAARTPALAPAVLSST
ncbi:MAG: hypothetical protein JOZ42_14150 [Acetobacteraceae bacterium]|nr:hypothetical protein [Acetobacteraceae bacterium]